MQFSAYISDQEDALYAADALIGQAAVDSDERPDVVFAFFSERHVERAAALAARLVEQLEPGCLVGCSAEGVIGFDREIERSPGLALLLGRMPGVGLHAFHIPRNDWPDLMADEAALKARAGVGADTRALVAFADPFTTPMMSLLPQLNDLFPGLPIVGGMASSARLPGGNALLLNAAAHNEGLVGLSIGGEVDVQTVVSQGCRPIGGPLVVTRGEENVILQLGGRPALEVLRQVIHDSSPEDHRLLRGGLFIGRVIDEYRERFARGDFLVRNVIGIDQDQQAIALADRIRVGQTVQFHVRDADTADEDLRLLLGGQAGRPPAAGGLLFSCNGRGTRLFDAPCHDIGAARELLPATPLAGFFAAGELGPIGGANFVHGHTASFALFRPRAKA